MTMKDAYSKAFMIPAIALSALNAPILPPDYTPKQRVKLPLNKAQKKRRAKAKRAKQARKRSRA